MTNKNWSTTRDFFLRCVLCIYHFALMFVFISLRWMSSHLRTWRYDFELIKSVDCLGDSLPSIPDDSTPDRNVSSNRLLSLCTLENWHEPFLTRGEVVPHNPPLRLHSLPKRSTLASAYVMPVCPSPAFKNTHLKCLSHLVNTKSEYPSTQDGYGATRMHFF